MENVCVSFDVTNEKPFNKCFQCHSFRNGCSGPNLAIMGIVRACEFLQSARVFLNYSYQQVADDTGVSLATVKRVLTGKISNPDFFTMSALSTYLLGDPKGKYPCAIPNVVSDLDNESKLNDTLRDLERALDDNKDYRAALDNIHISYKVEMDAIRAEAQKTIDYLMEETKRLRSECNSWRLENERNGKIIDTYISKLIT